MVKAKKQQEPQEETILVAPPWALDIVFKLRKQINNVFLIHGKHRGYIAPGVTFRTYTTRLFAGSGYGIVAFWNRVDGITFGEGAGAEAERMEERFNAVMIRADLGSFVAMGASRLVNGAQAMMALDVILNNDLKPSVEEMNAIAEMQKNPETKNDGDILLESYCRCVVVIDNVDLLVPDGALTAIHPPERDMIVRFKQWAMSRALKTRHNPVLLLTDELFNVHSYLRDERARIGQVEVPNPTEPERLGFIRAMKQRPEMEVSEEMFARMTTALDYGAIEDCMLTAIGRKQPLTMDIVRERTVELIRQTYGGLIQILSPDDAEEVWGLDETAEAFARDVAIPLSKGDPNTPVGVLFAGPPGTGKTALARWIAREYGIIVFELSLNNILSKWVGDSEGDFERALKCFVDNGPCFVVVDEYDQMFRRTERDEGNSVQANLFNRWLRFLSDPKIRGQVTVVALTNEPKRIDPAQKRPGRIDEVYVFLTPDEDSRNKILGGYTEKLLGVPWSEIKKITRAHLVNTTEGWTSTELRGLVTLAQRILRDEPGFTQDNALDDALVRYLPTTQEIPRYTSDAIDEVRDLARVPERYRAQVRQRQLAAREKLL
jgi:ATP-dependent 26S proteasome regulatory subunit